jgi:hypothetical protein
MLAFCLGVNEKGPRPDWPKRRKTQNEKTHYGVVRGDRLPVRHHFIGIGSTRTADLHAVCDSRQCNSAKRVAGALAWPAAQLPPARRVRRLSWRNLLRPRWSLHRTRLRPPSSPLSQLPAHPPLVPSRVGWRPQLSPLRAPPRLPSVNTTIQHSDAGFERGEVHSPRFSLRAAAVTPVLQTSRICPPVTFAVTLR